MTGVFLAQEQIILENPRKKNQTELEDKITGINTLSPFHYAENKKTTQKNFKRFIAYKQFEVGFSKLKRDCSKAQMLPFRN